MQVIVMMLMMLRMVWGCGDEDVDEALDNLRVEFAKFLEVKMTESDDSLFDSTFRENEPDSFESHIKHFAYDQFEAEDISAGKIPCLGENNNSVLARLGCPWRP